MNVVASSNRVVGGGDGGGDDEYGVKCVCVCAVLLIRPCGA